MLFLIENKKYMSPNQLRTNAMLDAYFIIKNYPLKASDLALDKYLQQQYGANLKNMCIHLLLSITFHLDEDKNLVGIFNNMEYDRIASLITYGNGAIPGSKILQLALKS